MPKPASPHRRVTAIALISMILAFIPASSARAQRGAAAPPQATLTQRRINEFAAACLSCQMALTGMKAQPQPGESAPKYNARIAGYIAALQACVKGLAPLRRAPVPQATDKANLEIWRKIPAAIRDLNGQTANVRSAVKTDASPERALLHKRLQQAFGTVLALLNLLRDARP